MVELRKSHAGLRLLTALAVLLFAVLAMALNVRVKALDFPEYQKYVHTFQDATGNWTYMEKPMFPVFFNDSQIGIGQNWSIVAPLMANHSYHAYLYGQWVSNGSEPKTDYDIYVYDPSGQMEGYHTESAGLPEHLRTTADETFFLPKSSGNYTFVINNDARESNGSQQATFMIVEDVLPDMWHEHYVEGKDNNDLPVLSTSWGYEFSTESQHVEVWVKVPQTLDMYEARLYLMADPKVRNYTLLNDVPLPWEPGLYGERNSTDNKQQFGGYNLESQEYRGVAYASCENYGQEMFLTWNSSHPGKSLYHLVFIGEVGSGTIDFLVKTEFGTAALKPSTVPTRVYPQDETVVAYISNSTDLLNATLEYSVDNWTNATSLSMEIVDSRTCQAAIPGQNASASVHYTIEANDVLKNVLTTNGSYSVKYLTAINLTLVHEAIHVGENVTVKGFFTPEIADRLVTVVFSSGNETKEIDAVTLADGSFIAGFQTENMGTWDAQAVFNGDESYFSSVSPSLAVKIEEASFLTKYAVYIGGGAAAAAIVGAVVYIKKFRQ